MPIEFAEKCGDPCYCEKQIWRCVGFCILLSALICTLIGAPHAISKIIQGNVMIGRAHV